MRYVPLASPALLARHAAGDVVDLGAMPMMRCNAKDDLQRLALSGAGLDIAPPTLPVTRLVRLTQAVREAAQRTLERG
ncbi:hypothetical protein ACEUE7_00155 [Micrococcus endophyticus]|uniref:hypothetical protein n=1 Tax=Micrococcus endophyticus TaxID=455343 RepID=UPI0035A8FDBF